MAHPTHSFHAIRRPVGLKRQRWATGPGSGYTRGVRRLCSCGKPHTNTRHFDLCLVFPRHRFGSSRFNTVFLLLFRLFYHASSFEVVGTGYAQRLLPLMLQEPATSNHHKENTNNHNQQILTAPAQKQQNQLPKVFRTFKRFSTKDWLATSLEHPSQFQHFKVNSITWVKALASPFSHEFIQFIVEDTTTGQKARLAAGREEDGDWVLAGWDWASGNTPSAHYDLPLPLLTLTFDDTPKRPDLRSLAQVLSGLTSHYPAYTFRREMCWWYAETVLDVMHGRFGGRVKEWEWARYRYSFIVKTGFIRRKVLTRHAEAFRQRLAEDMCY